MAQRKRASERRRPAPRAPAAPRPHPVAAPPPPKRAVIGWRERASGVLRASAAAVRAQPIAVAVGAAIVAAAFGLYLATAARDIAFGDTPELTAVALTLGVAHPPGYPIFTMIGWLFGQLPVGPLPFRIALFSVVCHTATVGVIYGTTYRFARSVPAAAVAASALAFAPLFWAWSLVGEVFPLNDLLAATMLLLVALWHEHPERKGLLIAGALVGGLGVANHQTIVLLAPAVFYVMWRRRKVLLKDPRVLVRAAIAFAIGLVPYLELLVAAARHPAWSWGDLRTPGDLLGHFLRQSYGTASLLSDPRFTGGSSITRIETFFTSLDPLQWLLLVAGTWYAWRRMRWYATYLLAAFVVAGPAFITYSNANLAEETTRAVVQRFFLMPYTVVAPLAGFAVLAAVELAARVRLPSRIVAPAVAGIAVVAALAFVPLDYREIDQSNNRLMRTFGEDLLSTIKPNSIFFAGGDPVVYSVDYLRTIEGARPDVTLIYLPLVPADWYIREVKRNHRDLKVPDDRYAPGAGQISSLIDANRTRTMAAVGNLPDDSTRGRYWFYSRGLVYEIRSIDQITLLDEMTAENEQLLASYHPARYQDLVGPFRSWERLTLVDYSQAYYRVGKEYEIGGDSFKGTDPKRAAELYDGARHWYEGALAILPTLAEAKDGIARVMPH